MDDCHFYLSHFLYDNWLLSPPLLSSTLSINASVSFFPPSLPHPLFLCSGPMASTWSTCKGSRVSSSSVKQRTPRGNGWSSLRWPCEYSSRSTVAIYITVDLLDESDPFQTRYVYFLQSWRSNIKPEKATANQHNFQMHTFEKDTNCRACKMLLRWDLEKAAGTPAYVPVHLHQIVHVA